MILYVKNPKIIERLNVPPLKKHKTDEGELFVFAVKDVPKSLLTNFSEGEDYYYTKRLFF